MTLSKAVLSAILIAVLVGGLALATFGSTPLAVRAESSADDWTMFNHDPAHTGYSTNSVPANPVLIWTFPNPNITSVKVDHNFVTTTPAVADGYLYVSNTNGGGFYCLNASTGTFLGMHHN